MSLKPRKIIKGIFVMLGMVAVFMGILVAGFIYVTEYKIHVISDSFSADRSFPDSWSLPRERSSSLLENGFPSCSRIILNTMTTRCWTQSSWETPASMR